MNLCSRIRRRVYPPVPWSASRCTGFRSPFTYAHCRSFRLESQTCRRTNLNRRGPGLRSYNGDTSYSFSRT